MTAIPNSGGRGSPPRFSRSRGLRMREWAPHGVAIFIAGVFLDSLRFKFTDAPKTQVIFGDLNQWAAGFGLEGIFAHTGLFSQYVIGAAELAAAVFLLAGVVLRRRRFLQPLGAALGLAVMTGAISFHLFTPLGVNVANDGGALFYTACAVWVGALVLLFLRRRELRVLRDRFSGLLAPDYTLEAGK